MAQPYVGEIRMFAGNFAPAGWMFCHGQLLPISENETLFQLIGTTYGGDGESTFALPDLRGRIPIHNGSSSGGTFQLAQSGGSESVIVTQTQVPPHAHALKASTLTATLASPIGTVPADASAAGALLYSEFPPASPMHASAIAPAGAHQPHENRMPFLCLSFIISLFGIFPSQT